MSLERNLQSMYKINISCQLIYTHTYAHAHAHAAHAPCHVGHHHVPLCLCLGVLSLTPSLSLLLFFSVLLSKFNSGRDWLLSATAIDTRPPNPRPQDIHPLIAALYLARKRGIRIRVSLPACQAGSSITDGTGCRNPDTGNGNGWKEEGSAATCQVRQEATQHMGPFVCDRVDEFVRFCDTI